jgi:hypothetical protein
LLKSFRLPHPISTAIPQAIAVQPQLAQSTVPEKLLRVVDEIDARGSANLTRLTVLKKWFERAGRLSAFALWVAARASSRKGKTSGAAAELFREARTLLHGLDKVHPKPNRAKAQDLHGRLRAFQSEHQRQRCGRVRIVHNWNLLLVEKGLAVHLWHANSPRAWLRTCGGLLPPFRFAAW